MTLLKEPLQSAMMSESREKDQNMNYCMNYELKYKRNWSTDKSRFHLENDFVIKPVKNHVKSKHIAFLRNFPQFNVRIYHCHPIKENIAKYFFVYKLSLSNMNQPKDNLNVIIRTQIKSLRKYYWPLTLSTDLCKLRQVMNSPNKNTTDFGDGRQANSNGS